MHYDSALQFIPHTFIEPYGYRDILDDNVKGTLVGAVDAEALRTAFAQFTAHRDDGISMDFKKDKIDLVYDGLSLTRKLSIPFRLKSPLKFVPFARIGHVIDAFSAFEGKVTIRVRDAVSISFYCGTRTAITMLMRKE